MGNSVAHLYLPSRLHSANEFLNVLDGFNKAIEGLWTVKLDQENRFPSRDGSTPSQLEKMASDVADAADDMLDQLECLRAMYLSEVIDFKVLYNLLKADVDAQTPGKKQKTSD